MKFKGEKLTLELASNMFKVGATTGIYPRLLMNDKYLSIYADSNMYIEIGEYTEYEYGPPTTSDKLTLYNSGSELKLSRTSCSLKPKEGGYLSTSSTSCFLGLFGTDASCVYLTSNLAKLRAVSGEVRLEAGSTWLSLTSAQCVIDAPKIIVGGVGGRDIISDLDALKGVVDVIKAWQDAFKWPSKDDDSGTES
jgi:hypothetical protein